MHRRHSYVRVIWTNDRLRLKGEKACDTEDLHSISQSVDAYIHDLDNNNSIIYRQEISYQHLVRENSARLSI